MTQKQVFFLLVTGLITVITVITVLSFKFGFAVVSAWFVLLVVGGTGLTGVLIFLWQLSRDLATR